MCTSRKQQGESFSQGASPCTQISSFSRWGGFQALLQAHVGVKQSQILSMWTFQCAHKDHPYISLCGLSNYPVNFLCEFSVCAQRPPWDVSCVAPRCVQNHPSLNSWCVCTKISLHALVQNLSGFVGGSMDGVPTTLLDNYPKVGRHPIVAGCWQALGHGCL
eukprot:scaffold116258_cov18-Tisochrysis_lutea.AAC.2